MTTLRCAVAAVLLSAALAFAGDVEKIVEQMGGADVSARYPAYRQLLDRKDPACVGPIVERIAAWDATAQTYGVSILQTLPSEATAGAWKRLLGSASPFVRAVAGRQVEDRERGARVIADVLAMPDLADDVLVSVLVRLYGNTDAAVARAVRTRVRPSSSPSVLVHALECLRFFGHSATLPAARDVAATGGAPGAAIAAAWLLRFGEDEHAPALVEGLRRGALQSQHFSYVADWLQGAEYLPPAVLDVLTERLGAETDGLTLGRLARVLGHARHAPAVPALRKLLESPDAAASLGAFDALMLIPGALDRAGVRARLESKDPDQRLAAAEALRRTDDLSGLPVVVEVLRTPSPRRWKAAEVLGGFRVDEAVEPLLEAMDCEDPTTRSYAASSLTNVLRTLFPYRRLDLQASGYRYDGADPTARRVAVERVRTWWKEHRDRAW